MSGRWLFFAGAYLNVISLGFYAWSGNLAEGWDALQMAVLLYIAGRVTPWPPAAAPSRPTNPRTPRQ
jgi:hypothetical protein